MRIYLEMATGHTIEDATEQDVMNAIAALPQAEDEQEAVWVSVAEEEDTVLEVQKDLSVRGIFSDEGEEIRARFSTLQEVEILYRLFLSREYERVQKILEYQQV